MKNIGICKNLVIIFIELFFILKKSLSLQTNPFFTSKMMEKEKKYRLLTEQIRSLIDGETDAVAVMANVSAAIHEAMGFFWTGFYRVVGDELVLGPFQGPVACVHIGYGRGVCGTAWQRRETIVVPDVEQFPGHIACSSLSRSEIVVPVFSNEGEVVAVLDIDSKHLATFDDLDRQYLEPIAALVSAQVSSWG